MRLMQKNPNPHHLPPEMFYTLGLEEHCQVQTGLVPLISKQVILYFTKDWPMILCRDALPKADEYLHNQ